MKVGVIGSGGREAALSWKLSCELGAGNVFTIPGNAGIPNSRQMEVTDFKTLRTFCDRHDIRFLIIGPEKLLALGIVDAFTGSGISVLGPDSQAARLESSKFWAKEFMKKYGVATAPFYRCYGLKEARISAEKLQGNLVIKYDGLAAGKGVFVCSNMDDAEKAFQALETGFGGDAKYLVEEKLSGPELSIIGFTDGNHIRLLLPSQDHKRLLDGNLGPNTGGMGVYCPVPFCNDEVMREIGESIIQPTITGIKEEKMNYRGIIYFGVILSDRGPKLLEYNVRLGDPETQVLVPSLKSGLFELAQACFQRRLEDANIEFMPGSCVGVVLATKDYPTRSGEGDMISGLETLESDTLVFHSGTKKVGNDFITSGGRILTVVKQADTLDNAREKVYREIEKLRFRGMQYRRDIGAIKVCD